MTGRSSTAEVTAAPGRRLFRSRLRDARIRSKLGLILVIPLIAVVALAGVRLADGAQRASAATMVRSLALVSEQASGLVHELHRERMAAAALLVAAEDEADTGPFNAQASRTDDAAERYEQARDQVSDVPQLVSERLGRIDEQLASLEVIRQEVLGEASVTASAAVLRYGVIVSDLLAYQESVGQVTDDPQLAESVRAVAAISKAKSHMGNAQATAFLALREGSLDEEQLTSFLATQTSLQEALLSFGLAATPEQLTLVNSTLTGDAVVFAERAASEVIRSAGGQPRISADAASQALGAVSNLIRIAERSLHTEQVALATSLRDEVRQQVLFESVAVVLAMIVAVVVALLLARMLARSLGRLREGALAVANRELPETVARFSDPQSLGEHTPAQIAAQVRDPIQLRSRDEVGQVAQAFNVVHQAAVRVAAEQAALRTSVSAMFLNLARRSQTLVDRMINQLDEIERSEEDPKRLSRLFALDHLATRMRRNDENLLILAGADSGPPRGEDAPLPDVLRASQSEVEHYDRIEFGTVDSDVAVVSRAVNDTVRLVAELLDNATRYSPPDSPVVAEARRLGHQVIIQIEDHGVGMPQDQVEQLNTWLAAPPTVEINTFRRMGLAVVARLASRHGIRVELRSDSRTGTIAYLALPPSILVLPQHRSRAPEIPVPRTPPAPERAPAAPPPLPARHLGQLPRRTPEVSSHAAWRTEEPAPPAQPASTPPTEPVAAPAGARADLPVAGRRPEGLTRRSQSYPDQTAELPIFREIEAVWFQSHGSLDLGHTAAGGHDGGRQAAAPTHTRAATATADQHTSATDTRSSTVERRAATGGGGNGADNEWRTAADAGWSAAAAAARPHTDGATRSGLPKRVPQAQLVPGGVEPPGPETPQRRSPDEVRGLLSAYHRGVQRGREHWGR